MTLSTSLAIETVRARLSGAPGWPDTVHRNRGRLTLWRDATGGAAGQVVGNVLDGNPNPVSHTASDRRPEIEFDKGLTLEFLVNEPDDAARETALDLARSAVLDALMPRPAPGEPRERTLGGLCAGINIEASQRSRIAQDATPGVAGFRIRLLLNMSAESLFGVTLGDGLNAVLAASFAPLQISASGEVTVSSISTASFAALEITGTGELSISAAASVSFSGLTASVSATVGGGISASAAVTFAALGVAVDGGGSISASASAGFAGLGVSVAATLTVSGDAVVGFAGLVTVATATFGGGVSASIVSGFAPLQASVDGSSPVTAQLASVFARLGTEASGVVEVSGQIVAPFANLSSTVTGELMLTGQIVGAFAPLGAAASAVIEVDAIVSAGFAPLQATAAAQLSISSNASAGFVALQLSGAGVVEVTASVVAGFAPLGVAAIASLEVLADVSAGFSGLQSVIAGTVTAGASTDPDADALIARMSVAPGTANADAIDALITSMKADGIWSQLDIFYALAAHDKQAAFLNWVNSSHTVTETSGAQTFTANDNIYCSQAGGTVKLDANYSTATDAVNYVVNSQAVGYYKTPNGQGNYSGTIRYAGNLGWMNRGEGDGVWTFLMTNEFGDAAAVPLSSGEHICETHDGTNHRGYNNAVEGFSTTDASVIRGGNITFGLGANMRFFYIGGGLTPAQVVSMDAHLDTYLAAIGAP